MTVTKHRYNQMVLHNNNFFPYRENHQFYWHAKSKKVAYANHRYTAMKLLGLTDDNTMDSFEEGLWDSYTYYQRQTKSVRWGKREVLLKKLTRLERSDILPSSIVELNPIVLMEVPTNANN